MSVAPTTSPLRTSRRGVIDRLGDGAFHLLTLATALLCATVVGAIVWKVFSLAHPAIAHNGLGFFTHLVWDPVKNHYGALLFLYGTAVSSFVALLIATPLSIAIGLYLSELAPRGIRGLIASLVEMLAAIPSVVLGLWGILVLGPFMAAHVDPWLHDTLGWTPMFAGQVGQNGLSMLTAIVILTIMIVPIISSISRELFLSVPAELEEGALALGATRWEMERGEPTGRPSSRRQAAPAPNREQDHGIARHTRRAARGHRPHHRRRLRRAKGSALAELALPDGEAELVRRCRRRHLECDCRDGD